MTWMEADRENKNTWSGRKEKRNCENFARTCQGKSLALASLPHGRISVQSATIPKVGRLTIRNSTRLDSDVATSPCRYETKKSGGNSRVRALFKHDQRQTIKATPKHFFYEVDALEATTRQIIIP
jgi:hypothetical protein